MKTIITLILLTLNVESFSKEIFNYKCIIDDSITTEISVLDKKNPSLSFFYKNKRVGSCSLITIDHQNKDPRSKITSSTMKLEIDKCTYYQESFKEKIKLLPIITFSQDKKTSFINLLENQDTVLCKAK